MFENTTTLYIRPGRVDESMQILRGSIVPILRSQPGLLSLALVPDPQSSLISVLSIWKSPAFARAVEANPLYRRQIRQLDPLILEKGDYTQERPGTTLIIRSI